MKEALLKTCHLPYIIDGNCYNQQNYLDGLLPYIFPEREKGINNFILYISPNSFSKIKNMFVTKNESTIYGRVGEGILDVYNFFLHNQATNMCSFVNDWSIFNFVFFRAKQIMMSLIVCIIYYISKVRRRVKPYLTQHQFYNETEEVMTDLMKDVMLFYCF